MEIIEVRVKPNARITKIIEQQDNTYKIAVKAPSDKGKANAELIKFLRKTLQKNVAIISGKASRTKLLKVL